MLHTSALAWIAAGLLATVVLAVAGRWLKGGVGEVVASFDEFCRAVDAAEPSRLSIWITPALIETTGSLVGDPARHSDRRATASTSPRSRTPVARSR